ncbi:MAG: hypothetical protein LBM02_09010 [Lachnospiraceae bacterium]|jgi:hypothetical protein|nr:hypothetical protein [Lachnospiraceae bacterium]
MGVKFCTAESENLIKALENNIDIADGIADRLSSGSQHLLATINSGELQGAAFMAGKGLFEEVIIPVIKKIYKATKDIKTELDAYKAAHSVAAQATIGGYADLDQLKEQLKIKKSQLELIEEQITQNTYIITQANPFLRKELSGVINQNVGYEKTKAQLQANISDYQTRIDKLEWFVKDVSRYFSDSLVVLDAAIKGATQLSKIKVDSNGKYYTDGIDMSWLSTIKDEKITTNESSVKVLADQYGLKTEDAVILALAFEKFNKSDDKDDKKFLAMMTSLCDGYRDGLKNKVQWGATANIAMSLKDAEAYFKKLGLSEIEVKRLYKVINEQHNKVSNASTPNNLKKRDFAHEMATLAGCTNTSVPHSILNAVMFGQIKEFAGYKGDIGSGIFDRDDMLSDTDAMNIYNRSKKNKNNIVKEFGKYNKEISKGTTNRAKEFLRNLGNGNINEGKKNLALQVYSYNGGDEYMANLPFIDWSIGEDDKAKKKIHTYVNKKTRKLKEYMRFLNEEMEK